MPHDPATPKSRSRFRVSLGGAMAAILVLACMFATWRGTRSWMQPTYALLWLTETESGMTANLTPELLEAAKREVISRMASSDVASGIRITSVPGTRFIRIECGTGYPPRDMFRVNDVITASFKSEPPGTFGNSITRMMGDAWNQGATSTLRLVYSLMFGMMAASFLDGIRRSLRARQARRSQVLQPSLTVAGAPHDPQR